MDLGGLLGWGEGAGAFGDVGKGWTWLDNFSSMNLSPGPNPGLPLENGDRQREWLHQGHRGVNLQW